MMSPAAAVLRSCAIAVLATAALAAQDAARPSSTLPAAASGLLVASLAAADAQPRHAWRDTPPFNADGTVNAYVEIPRGDRRKWEFDMRANRRAIDRVLPPAVGGYPVNYGFVPQTVSYDGDPFDVLVLGPPLSGGRLVRGVIVGLMLMEDEKGHDSKVVLSPVDAGGRAVYRLAEADRRRIAEYFRKYKRHEQGKFSKVPGWGTSDNGRAYVSMTHTFFRECRGRAGAECRVQR